MDTISPATFLSRAFLLIFIKLFIFTLRIMKFIFLLALLPLAYPLCTYTCWDVASGADTFAACTTTATIPINSGGHTFVEEVHDGTLCGTCAYSTDRRKGMFIDVPNSWTWIAFADLYNPRSCGGAEMMLFALHKTVEAPVEIADDDFLGCPAPGMYTPKTSATVRGKAGVAACDDQAQYLGTLEHGQAYHVLGNCGSCIWCYGDAGYPVSQQQTTVLCSDLEAL